AAVRASRSRNGSGRVRAGPGAAVAAVPSRGKAGAMTLPPSRKPDLWQKSPAAALEYELAQEKASALGRLGRALESALQALAAFDAAHPAPGPAQRRTRSGLVAP